MFIYWLVIVIGIFKVAEFIDKIKNEKYIGVNINKKRKNSIPREIKYL